MPVIWQSSQQPMYVRTVWVDGLRHAILTTDDPYYKSVKSQKRPHTTTGCRQPSRLSYQNDNLEQCFRKINFVIQNNQVEDEGTEEIEKLDLSEISQQSDDDFVVKSKTVQLIEYESSRSKLNSLCLDMRTVRSNRTARTDVKENTELSDRVLQWLDLAGKVDLLAPEPETTRLSQPRHSWPIIQNRNAFQKSKTVADLKAKCDSRSELIKEPNIDRHDFHVPVPSNTIENYARQSRKAPSRDNGNAKTKEYPKTRARELATNVYETRQKMASERHAVEKQYAELVSKKVLPDFKCKKQVHIFMPPAPVPKKTNSNITGITESLLSQLSKSSV